METTIEVPNIEDFNRVNELAKQVHEIHVNWRPDLFLSAEYKCQYKKEQKIKNKNVQK